MSCVCCELSPASDAKPSPPLPAQLLAAVTGLGACAVALAGELGPGGAALNGGGAGFTANCHQPSHTMLTVPASKVSVPLTVVMRTLSSELERVTEPPIM